MSVLENTMPKYIEPPVVFVGIVEFRNRGSRTLQAREFTVPGEMEAFVEANRAIAKLVQDKHGVWNTVPQHKNMPHSIALEREGTWDWFGVRHEWRKAT